MREIVSVSSYYDEKTRTTAVQVGVAEKNCAGVLIWHNYYTGEAKWNKKDTFDPMEGIRIAYERALAQIPKETIIEKCGGLKDGDWVCIQSKNNDYTSWGIVFRDNILYIMGSGNYDKVSYYLNGETDFDYITTIVRPIDFIPVTFDAIKFGLYREDQLHGHCKVYTAD